MSARQENYLRLATALLASTALALTLFVVSGCAGGTTGTGGTGSSQVSGKVADDSGAPVANAELTIEETGDSAKTDAAGDFLIDSSIDTDALTLLVQTSSAESKVMIDEIPSGPQTIDVTLELSRTNNAVKVTHVHITARATPTPQATATPPPAAAPTGAPTATPAPVVTNEPAPTAAPTETPTPVASDTATPTPTVVAIERTHFLGKLVSSDSTLLAQAKIGVAGKGVNNIASDGTFDFRERSGNDNGIFIVRDAGDADRASVDGISDQTRRVVLRLRVERKANGNLVLTVEFTQITDRGDFDQ